MVDRPSVDMLWSAQPRVSWLVANKVSGIFVSSERVEGELYHMLPTHTHTHTHTHSQAWEASDSLGWGPL